MEVAQPVHRFSRCEDLDDAQVRFLGSQTGDLSDSYLISICGGSEYFTWGQTLGAVGLMIR